MPTPQSIPPPINASIPAIEVVKRNDRHSNTRRVFVGPTPERALTQLSVRSQRAKKARSTGGSESDSDDESLTDAIKHHAFQFFLGKGGREEDWDQDEERHIRQEMLQRWRESEYYTKVFRRRRNKEPVPKWVGGSFEVGDFLGVNVIHDPPHTNYQHDSPSGTTHQPSGSRLEPDAHSRSNFGLSTANLDVTSEGRSGPSTNGFPPNRNFVEEPRPLSDSSSAPLLPRPGPSGREVAVRFASDEQTISQDTHVNDTVARTTLPSDGPLPPSIVLGRSGPGISATSAGAAELATAENAVPWGEVVMRDRMLCRVLYSREDVGTNFDEEKNSTARHLTPIKWGECLLVWRKDRLEIYDEYKTPLKERLLGHKRLAHTIPLDPAKTKLSCYCFVDLTFCLTSAPKGNRGVHKATGFLHGEKGLNVYIFKARCRTRAADWMWQLWRQLGGILPPFLEVRIPVMDTRLKIDIPEPEDWQHINALLTNDNVLAMCTDALKHLPDWDALVEEPIREGDARLHLAWRMDLDIDWVQEYDIEGKLRPWAVTCGIAMKQAKKMAHLELRLGRHFPTHLHTKDGSRLDEPPSIEGYLDRIRPNTQAKHAVYLATHDGNLFSLNPSNADPPRPPGMPPFLASPSSANPTRSPREQEVLRGARQILDAGGVIDLRNVLTVRRAFQPHAAARHDETPPKHLAGWEEQEESVETAERTHSDDEDEGGEEALAKSPDKPRMKMRRSFELLLMTGHVIRFEAYSRRVALEWIDRLRTLVAYWKKRHHIDARDEMDLVQASHPRLTPQVHVHGEDPDAPPELPPDPETSATALSFFYNHCILDGCRSILKGGRLYVREGMWGQYKYVQAFLVSGHLVQYRIMSQSSLHRRRKKHTIHLLDAYVCSGAFAAQTLPNGQYDPNAPPTPRRYQDGLEADDREEETLFMVWYKSHKNVMGVMPGTTLGGDDAAANENADLEKATLPELDVKMAKRKVAIFRTRSRLERDVWCWAINCEIEKVVRASKDREVRVREDGGLVEL